MKQAIILTAVITLGVAFPVGLICGMLIQKSTTDSKIATAEAQARADASKAENAIAQVEYFKKQYELFKNDNVKLSQDLSYAKSETAEVYNAQQRKIQSLKNEKIAIAEQLMQEEEEEAVQKSTSETITPKILDHFGGNLTVGQVAYVNDGWPKLKVIQVADTKNAICEMFGYSNPSLRYSLGEIWLSGVDTNGLVDGAVVKYDKQLIISGTKSYLTAGGSKSTDFVLEPYER